MNERTPGYAFSRAQRTNAPAVGTICCLLLFGMTALLKEARAEAACMREPPPAACNPGKTDRDAGTPRAYPEMLANAGLSFYQVVLRRFIPSTCPMEPSCSNYAREAIARHGVLPGTLLTADRLLHEKTEAPRSRKVWREPHGWRSLDPVEKHTRWWKAHER